MSSPLSYVSHNDPFRTDLVSWTLGNSDYDQEKHIYIDADNPERSFSASEARTIVKGFIAGFLAKGLKPGDCVCVYAFNDIIYPILLLGIIGAGGRFTGCNPAYTAAELNHHLRITNARFLITEAELLQKVTVTVDQSAIPHSNVFVLEDAGRAFTANCNSVQDLLKYGERDWVKIESEEKARTTTAALLSTSGTTGFPKAAMYSHYSCTMMNHLLNDSKQKPYEVSRLISVPMFHMYAFPIAHIAPLREGIQTHIMRRFELGRYLAIIDQYRITETPMVPAIIKSILKRSSIGSSSLQSLYLVWTAGTTLDRTTQDRMHRLLMPSARVVQVWGMTEAGYITTFLWPERDHSASVGRLLPGVESKLLAEDDSFINADHEQGEIYIRGPLIMQGYLGDREASDYAVDPDGWLKTGDIGYRENGKFYIVDRKKEMIKVRGWQVSPAELESVLMLHSDVLDCAVIGITAVNSTDEAPRAYIVKRPGSQLNATVVKAFMSTYLAKYKSLEGGIVFIDSIPKNSTGKVVRRVLKERAELEAKEDFRSAFIKKIILSAISRFRQSRANPSETLRFPAIPQTTMKLNAKRGETLIPTNGEWPGANCNWTSSTTWSTDCRDFIGSNQFASEFLCSLLNQDDLTDRYIDIQRTQSTCNLLAMNSVGRVPHRSETPESDTSTVLDRLSTSDQKWHNRPVVATKEVY